MTKIVLKINREFSHTPGSGLIKENDGPHSGEEFRMGILQSWYNKAKKYNCKLVIDMDGTAGIAACWIEEAFGKFCNKQNTYSDAIMVFEFRSTEEPSYAQEAWDALLGGIDSYKF